MHEEEHCTKEENCASVLILPQIKVWICKCNQCFICLYVWMCLRCLRNALTVKQKLLLLNNFVYLHLCQNYIKKVSLPKLLKPTLLNISRSCLLGRNYRFVVPGLRPFHFQSLIQVQVNPLFSGVKFVSKSTNIKLDSFVGFASFTPVIVQN